MGERAQCPYGFSVWPIKLGATRIAVTGVIGAPRLGGDAERWRAKEYPHNRVNADAIPAWAKAIAETVVLGGRGREEEFARRLEALHEIRRFNQIIRTNMERACYEASPKDPDDAPVDLVRAHRASALISVQLDALDLLANPASAMSFEPQQRVFYKTVDKIVRMYQVIADNRNVKLQLRGGSMAEAQLDNRTIHIIPSVFVDNAVKYSEPGEAVDVHVWDELRAGAPVISVEVASRGPAAAPEEEQNLFVRRGRGQAAKGVAEGSGIGLTLAKIVADQHKGWISASQLPLNGRAEWKFKFQIPRAKPR
ncbi:MAG TPA: HAMP domain-containing sensor histidine kinase [Bryobacteraceae bacterium]|nr:HAMP domain-containing sensor histidine kinase [Bryobacteraceae bacterium]